VIPRSHRSSHHVSCRRACGSPLPPEPARCAPARHLLVRLAQPAAHPRRRRAALSRTAGRRTSCTPPSRRASPCTTAAPSTRRSASWPAPTPSSWTSSAPAASTCTSAARPAASSLRCPPADSGAPLPRDSCVRGTRAPMLPPGCRCRCTTAAGAAAAGVAAADDDDNAATATRPHQRRHYRRGCRLRLRSAKFSRPTHALSFAAVAPHQQHHGVQPRADCRRLRQLLCHALPAHRRQGQAYGGLPPPQEGRLSFTRINKILIPTTPCFLAPRCLAVSSVGVGVVRGVPGPGLHGCSAAVVQLLCVSSELCSSSSVTVWEWPV
jgi:hypothetical protein